jgi:hypothetical protein
MCREPRKATEPSFHPVRVIEIFWQIAGCFASRRCTQRAIEMYIQCLADEVQIVTRISFQQSLADRYVDFRFA